MQVLILDVGIDTIDPYSEEIDEYWINIQLKSGKKLTIDHIGDIDLRPYLNQKIECLIGAGGIELIDTKLNPDVDIAHHSIIKGNYIENYKIPAKWKKFGNLVRSAIKTTDGIYIIGKLNVEERIPKNGEEIVLDTRRYDLLDWYPLE